MIFYAPHSHLTGNTHTHISRYTKSFLSMHRSFVLAAANKNSPLALKKRCRFVLGKSIQVGFDRSIMISNDDFGWLCRSNLMKSSPKIFNVSSPTTITTKFNYISHKFSIYYHSIYRCLIRFFFCCKFK